MSKVKDYEDQLRVELADDMSNYDVWLEEIYIHEKKEKDILKQKIIHLEAKVARQHKVILGYRKEFERGKI